MPQVLNTQTVQVLTLSNSPLDMSLDSGPNIDVTHEFVCKKKKNWGTDSDHFTVG